MSSPREHALDDRLFAELDRALQLTKDSRIMQTAARYRQILATQPRHAEALHALGMIAKEAGRLDIAAALIRGAMGVDPSRLDFVGNLGNVLRETGQLEEAAACYQAVLEAAPGLALAHNNLGNVLQEQGDLAAAVDCYRRALDIDPNYAEAWSNLGGTLQKQHRSEEAVGALRRALDIQPNDINALLNLGTVRQQTGAQQEAIDCFRKALALNPKSIAAHNKLQRVCLERGDYEELLELGEKIKQQAPQNQMAVACEAFARLAKGEIQAFEHLYGDERLPHREMIDPPPEYPDRAAFNEALVAEIMAHPSLKWIHDTYDTTRRGFVYSLLRDPAPATALFGELLHARIDRYRRELVRDPAHPFFGNIPERFSIRLWTTILNAGGHHPPHHHEHNWLSGVYYAKVPKAVDPKGPERAGWIEFDGFTDLPGLAGYQRYVRRVAPAEGLLVLFPSYFMHNTVPFEGEDTRISLAFDIAPL
jgi:uncharacterized protein (TIGR02466 family)